jgi:phosphoglycolate phosphatase
LNAGTLPQRAYAGVLYDLDGTLLDTAADIMLALNRALAEVGWQPMAESDVRQMIGRGGTVLVERTAEAQGRRLDQAACTALVDRFYEHYGLLESTHEAVAEPYPGVEETVRRLHAAGLRTAVVTNKQHRFAVELMERLGLDRYVDLIVGGDTCERRKPDPQPLLHACSRLGIDPARTLSVGDSINDVRAARGAGIPVVCVTYGYNEGQDPHLLPCDAFIDNFTELPALLRISG